ncbi:MAG: ATP-grasp domain-containing protein [Luteococcus sp.]|uniref:ATP-grasp domain-containing protein n=1 Tax=Luteococcus sp. TaxID=1969402 RepID=UPI00264A31A3|nr:ATP-grasp domain-containing protein [Luteococcus sp.]MDN5563627.1 ATP-grasp domain-containing protein [Luteococcus sp.]
MPTPMSAEQSASRPMVVFVDLGTMLSFDQLAACLHRRGIEVVHVTVADNLLARVSSRVLYDQSHYFSTPEDLDSILGALPAERVVDVQCPEFLLDDVIHAAHRAGFPGRVVEALEHRFAWRDKLVVSRALTEEGLPVPPVEPLLGLSGPQLVHDLGLPLVIKQRIGSGGEGVRIVSDVAQLDGVVDELGGDPEQLYAERFEPGETLCYAAAYHDGVVTEHAVYRTIQATAAEGPSSTIEVTDDPEVARVGDLLVRQMKGLGLVNLDLVRDKQGTPQVVDVNLRAWHSIVALGAAGHHFVESYLECLGVDFAQPRRPRPLHGREVHVFPDQTPRTGARWPAVRRFVGDWAGQRRVLPAKYVAVQLLLFLRRLL